MKQLGEMIVSKTLKGQTIKKNRKAARGIIKDGNKVYMIESFNRSARDGSITIVASKIDEGNNPENEAT